MDSSLLSEKREILIFGYLRDVERKIKLSSHIPTGVAGIIIAHYPLPFRLHYPLNEREHMHISNDGLSFFKKYTQGCTLIRFGDFINKSEKIAIDVVFELSNVYDGVSAFGFVTSEYVESEEIIGVNYGLNHTLSVTGTGYMVTTPGDFKSEYIDDVKHIATVSNKVDGFLWENGDKLHVEIDMISQKGRMWNDDNKTKDKIFECEFAGNAAVAILADLASSSQTFKVVSQTFRYK